MAAVSRVRASSHIRILPQQPCSPILEYLIDVKPDPTLLIWLEGCESAKDDEAASWSVEKAQAALDSLQNKTTGVKKERKPANASIPRKRSSKH